MAGARPPLVLIAGPTASGKSALAATLAAALGGTVINADSMQVYRELRVLTARPDAAAEAAAPHRLYGILSAAERCSAGRWLALALPEIAAARLPIVVGGTGLYFRALTEGLAPVPEVPQAALDAAEARYRAMGGAEFRAALAQRDPAAAALPVADRQRLVRLHAVLAATGRSLSDWQRDGQRPPLDRPALRLVLELPRPLLHARIDARVPQMLDGGALQEVRGLLALGLDPRLPAMKAVGVRALAAHLRGEQSLAAAMTQMQAATRQYAKRQETWFRHQMVAWLRRDAQFSERLASDIFSLIKELQLTTQHSLG